MSKGQAQEHEGEEQEASTRKSVGSHATKATLPMRTYRSRSTGSRRTSDCNVLESTLLGNHLILIASGGDWGDHKGPFIWLGCASTFAATTY